MMLTSIKINCKNVKDFLHFEHHQHAVLIHLVAVRSLFSFEINKPLNIYYIFKISLESLNVAILGSDCFSSSWMADCTSRIVDEVVCILQSKCVRIMTMGSYAPLVYLQLESSFCMVAWIIGGLICKLEWSLLSRVLPAFHARYRLSSSCKNW
jgi:hypothetical protein